MALTAGWNWLYAYILWYVVSAARRCSGGAYRGENDFIRAAGLLFCPFMEILVLAVKESVSVNVEDLCFCR